MVEQVEAKNTEIHNQNGLNVTDERLAELREATTVNQGILKDIQDQRAALKEERAKFQTFQEEEMSKLRETQKQVKRESDALARQKADLKK